ncbi:glutathione S-transferase family protein [Caulobacter sp. NIBR1757]|uniref:glutathione S-transferase family protein n=1 Tax=Caulobacter sp. NIBR1757 TaxID=3016000 RepID=UPI0022F04A0D|nr:glutathione S-transferase family protein [Caulobacter sp. NIBR1757]WGM39993.1 Disulfide-bond oxidoreductase YfcG [Caulobacter sp. NIBR1757]
MSITVFGDSISGNCLKVKWTADRIGTPYRWVETDILKGESRTPDFMARNPAGQVPLVVLEDGRALAQSNAIILHLAEGTDLVPKDSYERAKMFEWLFWEQYSHEPYVAVARFQMAYLGKAASDLDPKIVERGKAALARLEMALEASPFLVGHHLTLADIALVAYTRVAHEGGFDLSNYPATKAWVGRVESALGI